MYQRRAHPMPPVISNTMRTIRRIVISMTSRYPSLASAKPPATSRTIDKSSDPRSQFVSPRECSRHRNRGSGGLVLDIEIPVGELYLEGADRQVAPGITTPVS
jgi:hypothetical protein